MYYGEKFNVLLFGKIATTTNLMAGICRDKAEEFGEHDVALTLHVLDAAHTQPAVWLHRPQYDAGYFYGG